ncbi:MAG: CPBP family glutamic-type intramembrane protease, partial [Vicinamibacteria bacterium]
LAVWRQGATPGELGLRADDLLRSGPAFLACALATVAAFVLAGAIDPARPGRLAEPRAVASYFLWAALQQFLVVSMLWRHARAWLGGGEPERMFSVANLRLALVASFAFALVHAPNGRLMALVFAAEMVWLVLFARFRNLFAMALAHAISALAVAEALQPHWLPTARVGLTYWRR